jgi:beta-glucosidase
LDRGASKDVTVELEPLFLSVFDTDHNSWQRVAGDYTFSVGGSSQELPLHASASLQ